VRRDRLAGPLVALLSAGTTGGKRRVPEASRALWGWFTDLSSTRSYHAAGPNPITYAEIAAYIATTGQPLRAEHVAAIRRVDEAWIKAVYDSRGAPAGMPDPSKAQPVSPAAFDAVFE
jgi:hypothetical protein